MVNTSLNRDSAKRNGDKIGLPVGGRPNGQYSDDAPPNATTKEIFLAIDRAKNSLNICMKSKGYEYRKNQ